jgi:cysteinyl-tRNA synthetase
VRSSNSKTYDIREEKGDAMPLHLYNSATRKKEIFKPIREGHVGIYVCGVTVYDVCHIGHARSAIVFDVLVRYLRARGFMVTYVRNFTDVDDKIIERANQAGEDTAALAERYIDAFYKDMHALGVLDADVEPRATEHINDMIDMVSRLMEKGHAYVIDGDVYFSVETFDRYGELSGRNLEDMVAGARIAVDEKKKNPLDFVLWKKAKPGEPTWKSPWGEGRPGWHIECSAMSSKYLGATFDIHGGGRDLIFPHHENERAQSMAANGVDFANWWVHNGFLTVESEKMSKSLGNFITIQDALATYHPQELRMFFLSTHYRSPLDFSRSGLAEIRSGMVKIFRTLQRIEVLIGPYKFDTHVISEALFDETEINDLKKKFALVMDDDLNTAAALGLLFDKVHELNRKLDSSPFNESLRSYLKSERSALLECAFSLGFFWDKPSQLLDEFAKSPGEIDTGEIESIIKQRDKARKEKDWAKADSIRKNLLKRGIIVEDGPKGTKWRLMIEKPE